MAIADVQDQLRPLVLDALQRAEPRTLSVHSVRGLVNYMTESLYPDAAVALALEGLVGAGLAHRVRLQSHSGAVSRVRYRLANATQRTLF